ncbi:centrosomal protein of 44 kDa [Latimeria chalumnae]|uniref:Centrosomal protein of 44 kDa n=1 Tax=Latimeria chalumnae TaxID=7897 RepID=M3XKW8_LATCH|nr:PREDICTED: centrosomal protein of 44 kDa [Latimeria chalumnae]XP_005993039.1 PREDICTED: centrosomal protein of 44 kDa [Latimeria chalumnae]XP_014342127.1 PREDICTED: centrosomal protein of 44 kDa [Latimeria chalumnae]|eukprot:XP_005993038.1 PREDICTED: centrosomal protein of 44 kDa [Latimeria chalumnae]
MATGDIKGWLRRLDQGLRLLSYPQDMDYTGLAKGDPAASLPIISYAYTSYSTYVTEHLMSQGAELTGKNDLRFIEAVYKVLRDEFHYKPVLTKQQFLQCGFAERKIQIVCDIIGLVTQKHKELSGVDKSKLQSKKKFASTIVQPEVKTVVLQPVNLNKKPLVERHVGMEVDVQLAPVMASPEAKSCEDESYTCEEDIDEGAQTEELQILESETQIEPLRFQLAECQEKLQKLKMIEERLQTLENKMKGKVIIEEKDWKNLLSRVVLLETELLLRSKKNDFSSDFNNMNEERTSSRLCNKISSDTETREETPESLHHQSSGYSSLLSTDTSPKAMNINSPSLTEISKETTRQRVERLTKLMKETADLLRCSGDAL